MIKFENTEVMGWEAAIRGMRNPMNSWEKSDSGQGCSVDFVDRRCVDCDRYDNEYEYGLCRHNKYIIGPNDLDLMRRLAKGGPVHAKYRRMITVYVNITAPLYWWKEFDTYKVGTVANSCSTMHKIADKEFTLEDFSCEHLIDDNALFIHNKGDFRSISNLQFLMWTIDFLNENRRLYLETSDELKKAQESYIVIAPDAEEKALKIRDLQKKKKQYWWQMIQLLPSSYNQKRTIMLNYEVLAHIYKDRKYHKLDEWREHSVTMGVDLDYRNYSNMGFCDWIKTLPYPELICGEHINKEKTTPDCFVSIPEDK